MTKAVAALAAVFLWIYLPDIGHGFLRDDYGWILGSRLDTIAGLPRLFLSNVGFYRPLVSTSFALDYAVWHLNPRGYGYTNLLLAAADAVLLFTLLRRFRLSAPAAVMATSAWAFNVHAVNMALLWTSGRTALWLCLFGLASVHVALARRHVLAGVLALAAMLCKEEAVLLPLVILALHLDGHRDRPLVERARTALVVLGPLAAALAIYGLLRVGSGAMGPTTAPDYYQFTLNPLRVLRNILEYLDRAATWPFVVGLVLAACAWHAGPFVEHERRASRFGAIWFVALYGLTVFLPVRSSLYALTPSLGSAAIVGAVASRTWRLRPERFARLSVALILVVVALVPVYRSRNRGWVPASDLAAGVMRTLQAQSAGRPEGRVIIADDPAAQTTMAEAFYTSLPEAVHLFLGPGWTGEIVPSPRELPPAAGTDTLVFELRDGSLARVSR